MPLGTVWLAASAAGTSALLDVLRPYLMVLSIALIAFGFWQARRVKKCGCKPTVLSSVLLWSATAFVVISFAFPQVVAGIFAG
jgi:hypothetical protein